MTMRHISKPMASALETIKAKMAERPPVWFAEGQKVAHRFSQRRASPSIARSQIVPAMVDDALGQEDDLIFEFAIRDLVSMLRAIRDAEQSPPPPEAGAVAVPEQLEKAA